MTQTTISKWLKVMIIGTALCGLLAYSWGFPVLGQSLAQAYPEFAHCYYPWLILLWITAIPCYIAMFFAWKIVSSIGVGQSFTPKNGLLLKRISLLALVVSVFFLVMNVIYLFFDMNHPGILLLSLLLVFAGIAASVICAGLSYLTNKAAELQEQSDWTI